MATKAMTKVMLGVDKKKTRDNSTKSSLIA